MLRRNLRRERRYPVLAASTIGVPVVFLLLFVYVLGDPLLGRSRTSSTRS